MLSNAPHQVRQADKWRVQLRHPHVARYERQKKVVALRPARRHARKLERVADQHAARKAIVSVFQQRMLALLGNNSAGMQDLFPGRFIPAPGQPDVFVDRGSSLLEQYEFSDRAGFFAGRLHLACESLAPVPWKWWHIAQPRLRQVRQQIESVEKQPAALSSLDLSRSVPEILAEVHSLWGVAVPNPFSPEVLECCRALEAQSSALRELYPVKFFFELETFANYLSFAESTRPLVCGEFAGNWLYIAQAALSEIHPTELCVPARLLDELLNIAEGRFAPIAVNEYRLVADGNHRLTACWMWNLLGNCRTLSWSLNNSAFQAAAADFVERLKPPAAICREMLLHLQDFLELKDTAEFLEKTIRPAISAAPCISFIPVLFVPEYCSGAVEKDSYDSGRAVIRSHPAVYESMAMTPDMVLAARASYHYTDRVLLPWFSIIDQPMERRISNL